MDSDLLRLLDEAHARQLPALIAEWSNARDERRWIARALRIDLALLTARPELAVPCVYRRCAFAGGPHETGFYQQRAALPDLTALRETVERWASQLREPWLRALRPPPVPVDGAVVEEYRTSLRGTLWLSDDGEQIGVVGDTTQVVWERATGRRVDIARPVLPAVEYWKQDRGNTWGRILLELGDRRIDIAMSDSDIIRGARTIDGDFVFVWGDDLDNDDFYAVLDARTQRLVWRQAGSCTSFVVLDHERMLLGHRTGMDVVKFATGEELTSWRAPFVGELVALPDGNAATRSGDVIRVYNVGDAIERPQVVHPSSNSWTAAAFSPDGTRLVTGQILCDARTGRFIGYLDCNGPSGWLEGGPPRHCQRLCNGVFVEITPFGLTIWDSHDGRQLMRDRERRARLQDAVAFDPAGQYHAIWNDRGTLQLFRLMQGTLVHELAQADPDPWERTLGFSADGSLLAWETSTGERFALPLAELGDARRIDEPAWEPAPRSVTVADGVLVVDGLAIPCDDGALVVSPDGTQLAGPHSHYRFERSRQ